MRRLQPLLAALASSVLYGLCFPPWRWRSLAWIALVPFLAAVRRSKPARALIATWVFVTAGAYVVGDWFPRAVANYYDQPAALGIAFFFGVTTLMAVPYYLVFALWYRELGLRLPRSRRRYLPVLAAAGWVTVELAREKLLTGNPWALLGYSQVGALPVMQIADVTGVYGIAFVLVAVNAALVELWIAAVRARRALGEALLGFGFAAGAALVVVGYGALRLAAADGAASAGGTTPIAVVQGNLDLGAQWRSEFYGRNLDAYLALTADVLAATKPAVVFWPEGAMTFFLDQEPLYRQAIAHVLAPAGAELVTGGPRAVEARGTMAYYNAAFLLSPTGEVLAFYDKQRLLPFAEYFPLPSLDFLHRQFGRVREFTPGGAAHLLPTVAGAGGLLICNEGMYPEIARQRVREGAEYFINLANDSWLGDVKFSDLVFDTITLRAVEQRRYLVRSSTSGPSAIVDPLGRVVVRTADLSRATASGVIAPGNARTPYQRFGDWFAFACAASSAGAWAAVRVRRKRERQRRAARVTSARAA